MKKCKNLKKIIKYFYNPKNTINTIDGLILPDINIIHSELGNGYGVAESCKVYIEWW